MTSLRRHASIDPQPDLIWVLRADHPAAQERRSIFGSTVVSAEASPRLLVSGHNSRKLGKSVTKGKWRGFPIYQLTLEERATCPRSCFHWLSCYGNALPFSRRHSHSGRFIEILGAELRSLQRAHPRGYVVRLHVLGDFFSVEYVAAWKNWLTQMPALHVFGFTAWQDHTAIGKAIVRLRDRCWARFAVRTSDGLDAPNSVTIWRYPEARVVAEGIICPAETGAAECCGSCTLCWSASAKTVVFVAHGPIRRGNRKASARVD